jgi:hypothetical protein
MHLNRGSEYKLDLWSTGLLVPFLVVPFITTDPFHLSVAHQIVIGLTAALSVYIMLRMDLLPFTVPAFMAIGGYAAGILAKSGLTQNMIVLMGVAFAVPALVAIPLGALVLRLRGTYFIFITYIASEILQLIFFETPSLTGGGDGISAVPPAGLFGLELSSARNLLLVTVAVGILATLITLAVTHRYRAEFSSIEENETLAESLGLAVWKYRTLGFIASAGDRRDGWVRACESAFQCTPEFVLVFLGHHLHRVCVHRRSTHDAGAAGGNGSPRRHVQCVQQPCAVFRRPVRPAYDRRRHGGAGGLVGLGHGLLARLRRREPAPNTRVLQMRRDDEQRGPA